MDGLAIGREDATGVAARAMLRSYVQDIVSSHRGRELTPAEVDEALQFFPTDELTPPHGLTWIARVDERPVGCVGLRLLDDGVGEVARLFVVDHMRRQGLARLLMATLEEHARTLGLGRLRLYTRADMIEARRLYGAIGFEEVTRFNDNPYADHWLERKLLSER